MLPTISVGDSIGSLRFLSLLAYQIKFDLLNPLRYLVTDDLRDDGESHVDPGCHARDGHSRYRHSISTTRYVGRASV